jgi:hypothetical protein
MKWMVHFSIRIGGFKFEATYLDRVLVSRSDYAPKPRVAATLGKDVRFIINPERVAPADATALRLNHQSNFGNPG